MEKVIQFFDGQIKLSRRKKKKIGEILFQKTLKFDGIGTTFAIRIF